MSQLLTIAESAERLRLSRTTVYQLVERGKLVAHRLGVGRGALRISEEDLAAFLASRRETKAPPKPEPPSRRLRHLRL